MSRSEIYLSGALLAAVALYLLSRTKQGALAADAVVAGSIDYVDMASSRIKNLVTSRGYRNNNPGNLRYIERNPFNGQSANDGGYAVYDVPERGTRALGHQLRSYAAAGLTSVRQIITRWAPATENNVDSYVTDVAAQLNLDPDISFDVFARLADLAEAIARHENGYVDSSYNFQWVYLA